MTHVTESGVAVFTGEGIDYFRLASLKGMLKLESTGLKFRGGALRPKLARELGLNKRDPYERFIEVIEARMAVLLERRARGEDAQ